MYAVRPVVLSTDDISPHQNAVYHVRPVRLNERVITEKRADLVDSVLAAKQEELVHGLLQLLARIRLYSATRGILIPHLNSDLPTGESFETVKNECSRHAESRDNQIPARIICHCNAFIPLGIFVMQDYLNIRPEAIHIHFYLHSSTIKSASHESWKKLISHLTSNAVNCSGKCATLHIIIHDDSSMVNNVMFSVTSPQLRKDSARHMKDATYVGENVLLRTIAKLLGADISEKQERDILGFSKAANLMLHQLPLFPSDGCIDVSSLQQHLAA